MSKLTELYAKRDREKAKSDYLRLDKAPRSLDYAPGYSGKLGQAVTARNKREFDKTAREKQARREEQLKSAEIAQGAAETAAGASLDLKRLTGKQGMEQQHLAGEQDLAQLGARAKAKTVTGAKKAKLPATLTPKQRADIYGKLRSQYFDEGPGGETLRTQFDEEAYGKQGLSGFQQYANREMRKFQPAPLPQPGLAPAPDMLRNITVPESGVSSYTTTGTQAAPSFGQQPVASPFAQAEQPTGVMPRLPQRTIPQLTPAPTVSELLGLPEIPTGLSPAQQKIARKALSKPKKRKSAPFAPSVEPASLLRQKRLFSEQSKGFF